MTNQLRLALLAACALASAVVTAQPDDSFAIRNATVMTAAAAGVIERGTVLVRNGSIVAVGRDVPSPAGLRVVDASGKVVTPGFFATGAVIGTFDLPANSPDFSNGSNLLSAGVDLRYAFNPASQYVAEARLEGVTSAIIAPEFELGSKMVGTLFSGQAVAVTMSGALDSILRPNVALAIDLREAAVQAAGGRAAAFTLLKDSLAQARAYLRDPASFIKSVPRRGALAEADLQSIGAVLQKRMPLLVRVNRASDILNVLELGRAESINLILEDAAEAWLVAGHIAAAGVPVIVRGDDNRPSAFDTLNATYSNAARLEKAGVRVAIEPEWSRIYIATRSPRLHAGRLVAHGMTAAGALAAVTINPARMFALDRKLGSIEPGKSADLVIWSGDPFETSTRAEAVFIAGQAQIMSSRQTMIRDRYLPKKDRAQ